MQRSAWNDIVSWQTRRGNNSTKYLLHASMTTTKKRQKWNLLENCHMYALKLFWNACTWHVLHDLILYGQWTKLHDRLQNGPKLMTNDLSRLISHILHTGEYKQYCHVGNTAKQCRLRLFQDSDFAGDLEDSKSTSGETLCIFGSHKFVPISWMCKKQTSVSHSSTEWEIISLDAVLRLDGIFALDLWALNVAILHGNTNQSHKEQGDLCTNQQDVRSTPHTIQKRKQSHGVINDLDNVDFIHSNVYSSHQEALLNVFEDNEAVIKMIIKRRSLTTRHVSRTHRVALDWLFDRINLHPKIQIKYIDTENQLADILTKGNFTRDEWNHLLCLFKISHFSSTDCSEVMSKRTQRRFRWRKNLQQTNAYNPFSDKSKKMIQDMGNVELFELCETIPKVHCSECLLCWNQGIVYCTCGHLLRESIQPRNPPMDIGSSLNPEWCH